jgi:hypothetical protein
MWLSFCTAIQNCRVIVGTKEYVSWEGKYQHFTPGQLKFRTSKSNRKSQKCCIECSEAFDSLWILEITCDVPWRRYGYTTNIIHAFRARNNRTRVASSSSNMKPYEVYVLCHKWPQVRIIKGCKNKTKTCSLRLQKRNLKAASASNIYSPTVSQ